MRMVLFLNVISFIIIEDNSIFSIVIFSQFEFRNFWALGDEIAFENFDDFPDISFVNKLSAVWNIRSRIYMFYLRQGSCDVSIMLSITMQVIVR